MKRTLVAALAAGLLLGGCATGDTGHLDPEISPDLVGPRSTPDPDQPTEAPDAAGDEGTGTPAPQNEVEAAFREENSGEPWLVEVTGVDPGEDDFIQVTTLLQEGDDAAVQVCEAVVVAAEGTGISEPSVMVRDVEGNAIAQRDSAAGDTGCSGQ